MKHIFIFLSLILAVPSLFGQNKTVQYAYVHHESVADPNNGTPCRRGTAFCSGGSLVQNITPASGCVPQKITYTETDGTFIKFSKEVDNNLSTLTSLDYTIKKSNGQVLYSVTLSAPWPSSPTAFSANLQVSPFTNNVLGSFYKSSDGTITIISPTIPGSVVSNTETLIVTVDPSCSPTATPSGSTFSSAGGIDEVVTQEYTATAIAAMSKFGKLVPGDVKYSELTNDHDGWYLMDGRNISTISNISAKVAANAIFGSTLPNMDNKYMIADYSTGSRMSDIGQNSFTVANSNIQAATLTAQSNGNHTHDFYTYNDDFNSTGLMATNSQRPSTAQMDNGNRTWTDAIEYTGAHTHNVPLGTGSPTAIDNRPTSKKMYAFVYLGE